VEDELLALGDARLRDVVADLVGLGWVDTGNVRALELQEALAEPQVDARGLDLLVDVVEGFDDEVPSARRSRMSASDRIMSGEGPRPG